MGRASGETTGHHLRVTNVTSGDGSIPIDTIFGDDLSWIMVNNYMINVYIYMGLYGYGSIPIDTIFGGLFTSINPSYFDVNYRGTRF